MSKTNVGRAAAIIAGTLADLERAMHEDLAVELGERIATALDKAEARGAKKACSCHSVLKRNLEQAQWQIDGLLAHTQHLKDELHKAITGSAKPAPQFDAEKVRRLIDVLSSFTYCGAINVADCGDLYLENARLVKRELFSELGIGE